jgi:hypothetical protein
MMLPSRPLRGKNLPMRPLRLMGLNARISAIGGGMFCTLQSLVSAVRASRASKSENERYVT